jgi:hypothetical protein
VPTAQKNVTATKMAHALFVRFVRGVAFVVVPGDELAFIAHRTAPGGAWFR